jgi:hypothetical protein
MDLAVVGRSGDTPATKGHCISMAERGSLSHWSFVVGDSHRINYLYILESAK